MGLQAGHIPRSFDGLDHRYFASFEDRAGKDQNTTKLSADSSADHLKPRCTCPTGWSATDSYLGKAGIFVKYVQGSIGIDKVLPHFYWPSAQGSGRRLHLVAVDGHNFHTVMPLLDYMQN